MAMFSNYVSSGEDINAPVDPEILKAKKEKAEKDAKAAEELKDLQSNDATSAFAGLIESQSLESKAESYKGSAPEEKDEDEEEVKPKKKPIKILPKKKPAVKKISPKKLTKKKPAVKKTDSALVGATEEISDSTQKAIEAAADLPSTPEGSKSADALAATPAKKKGKVDVSKFLPKKKKAAPVAAADGEELPKPEPKKPEKPKKKIAHKVKKDDLPPQLYQRNTDSLPFGAMMRKEESVAPPLPKDDTPAADSADAAPANDQNVDA